jgi:hypothetical protein
MPSGALLGKADGDWEAAHNGQTQQRGLNMDTASETIRVVVFHDNGMWVAQCLEHDIGAQAIDIDTLNSRLDAVLRAEINESVKKHGKPFAGIAPAPERFQLMWKRRTRSLDLNPTSWMTGHKNSPNLNFALVA